MILEVQDAVHAFGGVRAVDGASFSVEPGTITGLIGPNGAGKSTMIDLISGFQTLDSGDVRLEGRSIAKLPPHKRVERGLVRTFQSTREWGSLTAMENVLTAAKASRHHGVLHSLVPTRSDRRADADDKERARAILADLNLEHVRNELAGRLSGGQKRLLELARIRMVTPKLLLLDEPLAGVNPILYERIAKVIQDLKTAGTTILLVEHNLEFVGENCDTNVVMALGKDLARGTLAELRALDEVRDAYLGAEEAAHV